VIALTLTVGVAVVLVGLAVALTVATIRGAGTGRGPEPMTEAIVAGVDLSGPDGRDDAARLSEWAAAAVEADDDYLDGPALLSKLARTRPVDIDHEVDP
jgi:hypothetical protein